MVFSILDSFTALESVKTGKNAGFKITKTLWRHHSLTTVMYLYVMICLHVNIVDQLS